MSQLGPQFGNDTLNTRRTLAVGNNSYEMYSLEAAAETLGDVSSLPFSLKVLLENLLRWEDDRTVNVDDIKAVAKWLETRSSDREIAYRPARVLMQDFTGVPAVVDLAAMRDAMVAMGADPAKINPQVPVDLVIDHSVMVDAFGSPEAFAKNVEMEFERNRERYEFLRWGQQAFDNFGVVPPGTGICHQVNLEYLAQVVWTRGENGATVAYPDTVVGTDSHTTMVNGLSVLGWGVGGIEAEAAMLGQPISMLIPEVVGMKLTGRNEGGHHRHRSGADGDPDAAGQGRGRQVRRILRRRPRASDAGRSGHHRQHGAGVRRHLRVLPGEPGDHRLSHLLRARPRPRRAGGSLRQGARVVARARHAGSGIHRHPGA